jgi:hypothetical protein
VGGDSWVFDKGRTRTLEGGFEEFQRMCNIKKRVRVTGMKKEEPMRKDIKEVDSNTAQG